MDSKVTYRQQVSFCGKPQCSKCRDGIGHGPYWYAYHTSEQGRTVRTYVGKRLPGGVQASQITQVAQSTQITQTPRISQKADVHERHLADTRKDDALLALADERIAQEAFSTAIEPLDQLIASNPTNEAVVQRLIFVLARLKRRGEAIRAYQKFVAALKSRHNTEPSTGTCALFEAIQRGDDSLVMPGNDLDDVGTDLSRPPSLSRSHPLLNKVRPLLDNVTSNGEIKLGAKGNVDTEGDADGRCGRERGRRCGRERGRGCGRGRGRDKSVPTFIR